MICFHKKKILFILIGESFRINGQHSREYSRASSIEQFNALNTQIELIKRLSKKYEIQIKIYTNFNKNLEADYKMLFTRIKNNFSKVKVYFYNPKNVKTYENLTNQILKKNIDTIHDKIILLRIDLILKDFAIDRIEDEIHEEKILFFNPQFYPITTPNYNMRVNDVFFGIDKKYFYIKDLKDFGLCHNFLDKIELLNIRYLNSDRPIKFLINSFHDPDSAKDWNPLYSMVGRKSNERWIMSPKFNFSNPQNDLHNYKKIYLKDEDFIDFFSLKNKADLYIKKHYEN